MESLTFIPDRPVLEPGVVLQSFYVQILAIYLFCSLIESLTKSQTFSPDWPELGLIRAE